MVSRVMLSLMLMCVRISLIPAGLPVSTTICDTVL